MQSKNIIGYVLLAIIAGGALYFFSTNKPMTAPIPDISAIPIPSSSVADVILKTNKGDIGIDLHEEQMPITTGNFLKLAKEGFYNGTKFHRVIANFMIQGGDPKGDGTGGPGYTIQDEFVAGLSNVRGTIAMANTGASNSGGSQFFINLVDNTGLDFDKPPMESSHPVFGKVVSGMEVVDAIAQVQVQNEAPVEIVVIESIEVK